MSEPNPKLKLDYQIAPTLQARRAPAWVWTVIGIYLLLWLGVLTVPLWSAMTGSDSGFVWFVSCVVLAFVLCGLGLLLTPVRVARDRPMSRSSFAIPVIASGLLFGLLVFGVIAAVFETAMNEQAGERFFAASISGGVIAWIVWSIVLGIASSSRDPLTLAGRFTRWLLVGSVAELLVAVPCHVIVRRRGECCAGIFTGTAICLGALVMFVAFGPSVLLLYYRRARQIQR